MVLRIGLAFVLVCGGVGPARGVEELLDRVLATVDAEIITLSETRAEAWALSRWRIAPAQADARALAQALDGLIERRLIAAAAAAMDIKPDAEALDRATVEAMEQARRNFADQAAFEDYLRRLGLSVDALRAMIRQTETDRRLARIALARRVSVSAEEVRAYVTAQSSAGKETVFYLLDQILIAAPEADAPMRQGAEAESHRRAVEIATRLGRGEDFARLAALFSDDKVTAEEGGNLGWVARRDLREPLRQAVDKMRVGDRSAPIRTPLGYHVVCLRGRRDAHDAVFREKIDAERERWLERLRQQASIVFYPYADAARSPVEKP
jgi:peptidyl-prolyl cis-trans isomerase SurA